MTRERNVDEGNVVKPLDAKTMDVYVVTKSISNLNSANFADNNNQNQNLILDSSCNFHMTSRKPCLENFKNINGGNIVIGNNATNRVIGIGNVTLRFENDIPLVLKTQDMSLI